MFDLKAATVRRRVGRFHRELLAHERMGVEELAALQDQRAARLAAFAMDASPF